MISKSDFSEHVSLCKADGPARQNRADNFLLSLFSRRQREFQGTRQLVAHSEVKINSKLFSIKINPAAIGPLNFDDPDQNLINEQLELINAI